MVERQVQATVAGRGRASFTSWEEMPAALDQRLAELAGAGYAGVVLGDVHLADVRAWYEERVVAAGLEHVEPLWGEDPLALVQEFVAGGGRAVVTCVDTERLDPAWLGRVIDEAFVEEIAATGADPCGENGEYHSFAFAGPAFHEPVRWRPGERRSDGRFVQLDLIPT
jgi:diphthamide synthase (EF-2-diphthine--ammonia ligase)